MPIFNYGYDSAHHADPDRSIIFLNHPQEIYGGICYHFDMSINTVRVLLMPSHHARFTKMIKSALEAARFEVVEFSDFSTSKFPYSIYDTLNIMDFHEIDMVLYGNVQDIGRNGPQVIEYCEDICKSRCYPLTCDMPPVYDHLPQDYQVVKLFPVELDFVTNLTNMKSNPGLAKRADAFQQELQRQYNIYLDRSARARKQGLGHKAGTTIVHRDKAEKMQFLSKHHKAMGGTMTGRAIIRHYRLLGKTISYHTMSKYIAELKEQPLKK